MTGPELAVRMGVSASRMSRIEHAEVDGSLQLSTLERAGDALDCQLLYVFVPRQPLEYMVRQQARRKAAAELAAAGAFDLPGEDRALVEAMRQEQLDALALSLIDRQGLWTMRVPVARGRGAGRASEDVRPP